MRNVYKDIFEKNKERIQFVSSGESGNETNVIYEPSQEFYLDSLEYLCVDVYEKNVKLLKKRKRVRNLKFFVSYGIPLICMFVASGFILKIPRKTRVIPTYALEKTVVSDEKTWTELANDNTYIKSNSQLIDDVVLVNDLSSDVQYLIKDGHEGIVADFKLDAYGDLRLQDKQVINIPNDAPLVDSNLPLKKSSEKYQELLERIRRIVEQEYSYEGSDITFKKMLNSLDMQEVLTIYKYVKNGEVSYTLSEDILKAMTICFLFIDILASILFSMGLSFVRRMPILEWDAMGVLIERDKMEMVSLFKTAIDEKGEFKNAEEKRKEYIENIVKLKLTKKSQEYFDV